MGVPFTVQPAKILLTPGYVAKRIKLTQIFHLQAGTLIRLGVVIQPHLEVRLISGFRGPHEVLRLALFICAGKATAHCPMHATNDRVLKGAHLH
jgi:hypothetical protein